MTQTHQALRSTLDGVAGRMSPEGLRLVEHVSGGKLLRGRLVMAVAAIGSAQHDDRALHAASQIELIHAGALIHDDLIDGSTVRRGRPTLWQEAGARAALFTGTALILEAGAELSAASDERRRGIALLLREVARGQTDELTTLFSTCVSPDAYLRRAQAKTGTLYELAARLGAWAGNLDAPTTHAVAEFAAKLGTGFQLADDVRDLVGGATLGRAPGTDLRVGVYTLPVLATLTGRFPGGERLGTLLGKVADGEGIRDCVELLRSNGALDYTVKRAKALLYEGIAWLSSVSSMRARVVLEAYACELLGPLRTVGVGPWDVAWIAPPGGARVAIPAGSIDPALRLACHPTVAKRLARLRRLAGAPAPLARAILAGGALVLLADQMHDAYPWEERAGLTGSVDLLLAEVMAHLATLPGTVAAVVARRLAEVCFGGSMGRGFEDDEPLRAFASAVVADARRC